jgi:DNA transformation protein
VSAAPADARLAAALLPLLRDALGGVRTRQTDGAIGLFLQGVLFGLIQDGILLFRVDARTRAAYDAAEAGEGGDGDGDGDGGEDAGTPFDPPGGGAMTVAAFRRVPPFVLDDEDTLADWGKAAWEAAKRSRAFAVTA